ncbi:hypothetical protein SASPL_135540 [Salvia splendens]|uniref:Uncharacterized protein n=1 Tax=Salvia splendens TaxID=180675 RepID=A0A8X8X0C8_SALSN|nr:hypothetical protein SASPL_135540 [Salvia splendens]
MVDVQRNSESDKFGNGMVLDCGACVDERREIPLQSPKNLRGDMGSGIRGFVGGGEGSGGGGGREHRAVEHTRQLRKGVAHAELVSVGEDKKEDTNKPAAAVVTPTNVTPVVWSYQPHYVGYNCPIYESSSSDSCKIM